MSQSNDRQVMALRHSTAHVMAAAVIDLFPGTKIGVGPPTENGFFYDLEPPQPLSSADLPAIESRMRDIIVADHDFVFRTVDHREAGSALATQPYKLELIDGILGDDPEAALSTYRIGEFEDLCKAPTSHRPAPSTRRG